MGCIITMRMLDPRMKLLIVVAFVGCSYLLPNNFALLYLYAVITVLYLLSGLYKGAVKTAVIFAVFELLKYIIGLLPSDSVVSSMQYMLFFLQRTSTAFIMVGWMSASLNISRLIASLYNMKMPTSITVSTAVIFRFFPTVKAEFNAIKNTMMLRGIGINAKNICLHPIKTVEYSFIPLFIRSMKIADEISVAAMTRGLGLDKKRSCYEQVRLTFSDVVVAVITLATLIPAFLLFNS